MKLEPIKTLFLKDDSRKITIFKQVDGGFLVHHEDYIELNESLTEYSNESFVKTYRLMQLMVEELALRDSEFRKELFNYSKSKISKN